MKIKIRKRIKSKSRSRSRILPTFPTNPTRNLAPNPLPNLNLHHNLALVVPTDTARSRTRKDGGLIMATKMVPRRWLPLAILCTFGLISLAGCGVKRLPVSGTVTLDGQPLNGGILVFTPDTDKGNTAKISCTSPVREGEYELETN